MCSSTRWSFSSSWRFLLENFQLVAAGMGIDYRPPDWDIVLPVGISFYTFQTLSYTEPTTGSSAASWPW